LYITVSKGLLLLLFYRIHGTKVAEMPFAATLPAYRKQGMMRRLVNAVEQVGGARHCLPACLSVCHCHCSPGVSVKQVLASVQVDKLVIPAIAALVDTWTRSFSFRPLLDPESREEIRRRSLVVIAGTTLLHKPVAAARPPSPHRHAEAAAPKNAGLPWWWKYTQQAPPLTDDERAFLDTAPLACSFTDLLVTGELRLCAGNSIACCSSASVR
jgi:hypothetical protein